MREPTPAPSDFKAAQAADAVEAIAAISTRRLASEAAIYAIANGLGFGLLGLVIFDRGAGLAGAVRGAPSSEH
jgi:hypothetical protein